MNSLNFVVLLLLGGHITGAGHELSRRPVTIHAPDCALMAIECAQTFAIQGEPNIWLRILGAGKQQITLTVILDLRYGTLVSLQ